MVKQINVYGLLLSYLLLLVILFLTHKEQLKLTKDILFSFARMSVQLFAAGFVLLYIFRINSILLTTGIYLFMIFFATRIAMARAKVKIRKAFLHLFISILASSFIILLFILFAIIHLNSLDARYVIPLAGMVIGNAMNSTTISMERFFSRINEAKDQIETLLCLGANEHEAVSFIRRSAFKSALLPSLSSASGMGIVFLPGMMTGQILSGVNPIEAVNYQIMIVIAISTTVALSNYMVLRLLEKELFRKSGQLTF